MDFIRTSVETRKYYEVFSDIISVFKLQAGVIEPWGGQQSAYARPFPDGAEPCARLFTRRHSAPRSDIPGPQMMRLAAASIGARASSAQTPLYFLPKDVGIKLAAFADAGNLWHYQGPTSWSVTGETLQVGLDSASMIRTSIGVGLLWDSPLGPLRFDLAYPLTKYCATPMGGGQKCATARRFSVSAAAPSSDPGVQPAVRRVGFQPDERAAFPTAFPRSHA